MPLKHLLSKVEDNFRDKDMQREQMRRGGGRQFWDVQCGSKRPHAHIAAWAWVGFTIVMSEKILVTK